MPELEIIDEIEKKLQHINTSFLELQNKIGKHNDVNTKKISVEIETVKSQCEALLSDCLMFSFKTATINAKMAIFKDDNQVCKFILTTTDAEKSAHEMILKLEEHRGNFEKNALLLQWHKNKFSTLDNNNLLLQQHENALISAQQPLKEQSHELLKKIIKQRIKLSKINFIREEEAINDTIKIINDINQQMHKQFEEQNKPMLAGIQQNFNNIAKSHAQLIEQAKNIKNPGIIDRTLEYLYAAMEWLSRILNAIKGFIIGKAPDLDSFVKNNGSLDKRDLGENNTLSLKNCCLC